VNGANIFANDLDGGAEWTLGLLTIPNREEWLMLGGITHMPLACAVIQREPQQAGETG